ncbi:MAG: polysaccharide deacetylase family protein [Thermodesulfobacteriota bacterium]|nr:polysaccharide deacetylase family protein [Thermodesulfobacteriota bacterium]
MNSNGLLDIKQKLIRVHNPFLKAFIQFALPGLFSVFESFYINNKIKWNGKRGCFLLSFDCDFPEDVFVLPEIVDILAKNKIKGSFACVGRWVNDYPDEHRVLIDNGFEIINHTYSHPELINSKKFKSVRDDLNPRKWEELSLNEKEKEIILCNEVVLKKLGHKINGFRAPHFGLIKMENIYPILEKEKFIYSSSTTSINSSSLGFPFHIGKTLEIPLTNCIKHPFSVFDTWHSFYARGGWHRNNFLNIFEELLKRCHSKCLLINVYLDPKDIRHFDLTKMVEIISAHKENIWMPTLSEFTLWFRSNLCKIE